MRRQGWVFTQTDTLRQAKARFEQEADYLRAFLAEDTEAAPDASTPRTELYAAFWGWCRVEGGMLPTRIMSRRKFYAAMEERGFRTVWPRVAGTTRERHITGLRLTDTGRSHAEAAFTDPALPAFG